MLLGCLLQHYTATLEKVQHELPFGLAQVRHGIQQDHTIHTQENSIAE